MLKNKTFWIGFIAVYVIAQVIGYVVHQWWLADTYKALAAVWRPEAEMMDMMWVMFVTSAIYLFAFCYIFTKGYEAKGVMEGVRFGFWMGLFIAVPMAFESWIIYPIPLNLAIIWFVAGMINLMILGAVFAAIYKPSPAGA